MYTYKIYMTIYDKCYIYHYIILNITKIYVVIQKYMFIHINICIPIHICIYIYKHVHTYKYMPIYAKYRIYIIIYSYHLYIHSANIYGHQVLSKCGKNIQKVR